MEFITSSSGQLAHWKPLGFKSVKYPELLKKRVLSIQDPSIKTSLKVCFELHRDLGIWYAKSLQKIIQTFEKESLTRVDAIANHGQTVAHHPNLPAGGVSVQLGDSSWIASLTGLTTLSNFRAGDLSVGGQGAPLVPLYHELLLTKLFKNPAGCSLHNLGGVSNFTYYTPQSELIAFDTGPANFWIDASVNQVTRGLKKFDRDGVLAKSGTVDLKTLRKWMNHPFFSRKPPKSTGRDDFPIKNLLQSKLKGTDLVATASALTVESIGTAYENFILKKKLPLKHIIFCGGGAKNKFLIEWLQDRLHPVEISTLEAFGLNSQEIEAQAFAYFGYLSLLGRSLGGPWTGAKRRACSGQLHLMPNDAVKSLIHLAL
jgi:anhydro-N-acetylmuramic acid kinase